MRRSLAVLALLATSWPHLVVLECAFGSTLSSGGETRHHAAAGEGVAHHGAARAAHHDAGHGHPKTDAADGYAGTAAGGVQCAMVMACGLVMLQSEGRTTLADPRSAPEANPRASLDGPAVAVLVADPPPPRRSA